MSDDNREPLTKPYFVHPSSYVDQPCIIGKGTRIWHFCHISAGANVGQGCNFGQNVFVGTNVRIGRNVKIQNNVSVYTGVTLEDDVFCGPSMVFTNVGTPRSHIRRNDPDTDYRPTLVKRGATLGANCTIVCGNTIGQYAFVGAGAVVTRDVPAYAMVYGNPARIRGWACQCGIKLQESGGKMVCPECRDTYRLVAGDRLEPEASGVVKESGHE